MIIYNGLWLQLILIFLIASIIDSFAYRYLLEKIYIYKIYVKNDQKWHKKAAKGYLIGPLKLNLWDLEFSKLTGKPFVKDDTLIPDENKYLKNKKSTLFYLASAIFSFLVMLVSIIMTLISSFAFSNTYIISQTLVIVTFALVLMFLNSFSMLLNIHLPMHFIYKLYVLKDNSIREHFILRSKIFYKQLKKWDDLFLEN